MNTLPITLEQCHASRVGLELSTAMPLSDWLNVGDKLFSIGSCYQFLIGDWLNYGEREYGEKYSVACSEHGLPYGTAANWASICKRIEFSRRRENLSWSHHEALAHLKPEEQDQWLQQAEEQGWSVATLRQHIRDHDAPFAGEQHGKPIQTWVGKIISAAQALNRLDVNTLGQDQRLQYKETLRPLVEFYQKL